MIADEILVQRYLAGERDAFRQLVERHTPALFNLAFRLTRDREEAADITQEAFRRAFEALPTSRTDLPFKPWLFQIAVNLCRDWAKRQRPLALADLSRAPEEGEEREDPAERVPDTQPLPIALVEAEETRQALQLAIEGLPPAYRAAIVLRYMEDMSYQDIAVALGLPLNTVRTHLARAKKALQTRLKAELGG
ncbi:MAG: sigma-70 family RNA polymerase sigma factor [Anaerolineae bacterium]|nr:sigma-70 family RNA polymerase sigma factor [Anaerolineae bacterium]